MVLNLPWQEPKRSNHLLLIFIRVDIPYKNKYKVGRRNSQALTDIIIRFPYRGIATVEYYREWHFR